MSRQPEPADPRAPERALVFDIDNTLTLPDKSPTPEIAATLAGLGAPFYVAAGSDMEMLGERFFRRLYELGLRTDFDAFLCNGTTRYAARFQDGYSVELVRDFSLADTIGAEAYARLRAVIDEALARFPLPAELPVIDEALSPKLKDRRAMLNVVPIGRLRNKGDAALEHAYDVSRAEFVRYDTATGYRARILEFFVREFATIDARLSVKLGGVTSFDINIRGEDKRYAVRTVLEGGAGEVYYFGDALFPGGNDEAVIELSRELSPADAARLRVVRVNGPDDTRRLLREHGLART